MYPSKQVHHPRAFEKLWLPFVRVFQYFCVSHFSIYHSNDRIGRLVYFIVFCGLHACFITFTLKSVHLMAMTNFQENELMQYISFMSVAVNFIEHAVAHAEAFFAGNQEALIYEKFEKITKIFANELNYVVDFDTLRRNNIRKTIQFHIFSVLFSFGLSFFSLPTNELSIFFFLLNRAFAATIIRVRRCQISIVVNLLTAVLKDLQILLEAQQRKSHGNIDGQPQPLFISCRRIRYLRDVYSDAWHIKNLMSDCFGWSFVTFLMKFSFDLINSCYWAYVTVKTYKNLTKILRKHCFYL